MLDPMSEMKTEAVAAEAVPQVKAEVNLAKSDMSAAVAALMQGCDKALGDLEGDVKPLSDGARVAAEAILTQLVPVSSPVGLAVRAAMPVADSIAASAVEVPVDAFVAHGLTFLRARLAAIKV